MQRYFFDVFDGEKLIRDEIGIQLPDLDQVRFEAIEALPDLARDELQDGDERAFAIEARDERDHVVFTARLNFKAEWR
jgi:hypothetical protein